MSLGTFDQRLINFFRNISVPLARIGLFVVYFWFGILKVFSLSPASPLMADLFTNTMPFMAFDSFLILFGLFECLIGILFLIRGTERIVIPLLFIHIVLTILPLFILSAVTWSGFFVPTLEGQYIIKNILIAVAAILVAAHIHPWKDSRKRN